MTMNEIETRRDELEAMMNEVGYTDNIAKEWSDLFDEEMHLRMKYAYAIARNGKETIFVENGEECGYCINIKSDGHWNSLHYRSAVTTMKEFASLARMYTVKMCLVMPEFLDIKHLKELDKEQAKFEKSEVYFDACMMELLEGDTTAMECYERRYAE